jgi:uncharacterized protein (DUF2235 family)
MIKFCWKTFEKWQCRSDRTPKERAEKKYLLDFMCAFRETFSRPVRRIRFLGLFDTVNSVPHFETAFLQRSKFPYTARSTAKVIRHAVAIDERRAKFRSDLISEIKHSVRRHHHHHHHHYRRHLGLQEQADKIEEDLKVIKEQDEHRGRSPAAKGNDDKATSLRYNGSTQSLRVPGRAGEVFRDTSEVSGIRSLSPGMAITPRGVSSDRTSSLASERAINKNHYHEDSDDDETEQDIQEVWFAGAHGVSHCPIDTAV